MVASLFGRPSFDTTSLSAEANRIDPIMKPHATMADAKDSLVNVIDKCIKFMANVAELKYAPSVPEEILIEQRRLDTIFEAWLLRFEDVAKTLPHTNAVNLMVRSSLILLQILDSSPLDNFHTDRASCNTRSSCFARWL